MDSLLRCGADKVGVNTAAINDPTLIGRVAERFGNQVLVLSVDARREQGERHTQSGFEVTTMGGRKSTGIDAIWWVKRAQELGAGEILLNSMDADGTQQGFDLEMIKAVRKEVKIPIIASGGAGKAADFPPRRSKPERMPCWPRRSSITAKSPSAKSRMPSRPPAIPCDESRKPQNRRIT